MFSSRHHEWITSLKAARSIVCILGCLVAGLVTVHAASLSQPVKTDGGVVIGVPNADSSVIAFKGIPFAAPPVGDLRWKPPVAPAKWNGVLKADHFSASCMQIIRDGTLGYNGEPNGGPYTPEFMAHGDMSEDCLYLNVWTPARSAADKLPVIVWIHGGVFREGSSSVPGYDGEGLARKGVVVVSLNYRLGIFGFLALSELSRESARHVSGNYGFLDQIAALQWVSRNIAAFGGNPKCVTIFGQSAGGGSVHFLSLSPLARGLFQRAFADNSTAAPHDPFLHATSPSAYRTLAEMESVHQDYLRKNGVESLRQLRAMSADRLNALPPPRIPPAFFSPNVDGWVLPLGFNDTYSQGKQADVPFLVGWTAGSDQPRPTTIAEYRKWAERTYGAMANDFLAVYPASTDEEAAQAENQSDRDSKRVSMFLWAQARQKDGPNKTFLFAWTHVMPGPGMDKFGVFPTSDIPYFMGALSKSARPLTKDDFSLSGLATSYLANFATNGDPNRKGLPVWPAFTPAKQVIMKLDNQPESVPVAPDARFEFFKRFFASQPAW